MTRRVIRFLVNARKVSRLEVFSSMVVASLLTFVISMMVAGPKPLRDTRMLESTTRTVTAPMFPPLQVNRSPVFCGDIGAGLTQPMYHRNPIQLCMACRIDSFGTNTILARLHHEHCCRGRLAAFECLLCQSYTQRTWRNTLLTFPPR